MMRSLDSLFPLYLRYGLKTGVACLLAYIISWAFGIPYPTWAVVSSIVAMQVNVAESLHAGVMRVTGTAVGAAAGVLMLVTLPMNTAVIGTVVFVVTIVCAYLTRFNTVWAAASIAAVVVVFSGAQHLSSGNMDAIAFGLIRVSEIIIGVGSAFFVSIVLWPVRLVDTLSADLSLQFLDCARLIDVLLNSFLSGEAQPYTLLNRIEGKIWDNHERLNKARKHESILYSFEHKVMNVQVMTIDRTAESLRSMMEALNDYDEEPMDSLIGPELRHLGDAIMSTLRHLGSESPTAPAPDLVRGLTSGVGVVEAKLAALRADGSTYRFSLHKMLQVFSFYQSMRLLAESLLISLHRMEKKEEVRAKKSGAK